MSFKKNERSEFFLKDKAKQNNIYTYHINTEISSSLKSPILQHPKPSTATKTTKTQTDKQLPTQTIWCLSKRTSKARSF